jgi:hypothetical protein
MTAKDYSQFHKLAEQLRGQVPLKKLCKQEGIQYESYRIWRNQAGISPRHKKRVTPPNGMLKLEAVDIPSIPKKDPITTSVHIEFENGLTLDRAGMKVDHLIEFLTKIRGALCLG